MSRSSESLARILSPRPLTASVGQLTSNEMPEWVLVPIILLLLIPVFLIVFIAALRTGTMPKMAVGMFILFFAVMLWYEML